MSDQYLFTKNDTALKEIYKDYIRHDKGYFILGPSGCGKTHYINNYMKSKGAWIDGDSIWMQSRAHPENAWWEAGDESPSLREVDAMSDIITYQAVKRGYRIIGASNLWLRPDAVVLPPLHLHRKFLRIRSIGDNYDGGLTLDMFEKVKLHRKRIRQHANNPQQLYRTLDIHNAKPVPIFLSVQEAVQHLESL